MPKPAEVAEELRGTGLVSFLNPKSLSTFAFLVVGFIGLLLSGSILETNNVGYYKILQRPVTGALTAYMTPGMFVQGFGDVYTYKASDILYFSKHADEGREKDDSIEVRFNDGATARVTGNVRLDLPKDPQKLLEIQKSFRGYDSFINDTVKQVVYEATILTAALMTAEESYTTKRAEFSQMVDDQVRKGVYLTKPETIQVKDAKTGETVTKQIVTVQTDDNGQPLRKESPFQKYGATVTQAIMKDIDYEKTVADQIMTKQQALMQVVSAKANAEKAIQDRLTAEEVGRKNVAVAKFEQEVDKQRAVTSAEKELAVSELHKRAEEQNKAAMILKGEGEGEYRRKLMVADGALDKKLAAYVQTQQVWADAMAKSQHPLVPSIVTGGGSAGGGNNAALGLMEIMATKAARDLSLDMKAKQQ